MVTVNPHLPIASKSMLVSTTAFGKGIVYQSTINELSTGKPCKDRGAGQQSGPIYGLFSLCEYFACRFDNTGSDGEAPVAEVMVARARAVHGEEGEFARRCARRGSCLPCRAGSAAPGSPWQRLGGRVAGCGGKSRTSGGRQHGQMPCGGAHMHEKSQLSALRARGVPGRSSWPPSATAVMAISGRTRRICAPPPARSATMTPSSETEALTAAGGMSSLRMLFIACGPKPSQRSCEPLQGAR